MEPNLRKTCSVKSKRKTAISEQPRPLTALEENRSTIEILTDDCLLSVLQFLPLKCLITLERVSSRWRRLSQDSWKVRRSMKFGSLFRKDLLRYDDEYQTVVRSSLPRCGQNLISISFSNCPSFRLSRSTLEMMARNFPHLETLDLDGRQISSNSINGLLLMSKLRELSIANCSTNDKLFDQSLADVLPQLRCLKSLNIRDTNYQTSKLWLSSLELQSLNLINTNVDPNTFRRFVCLTSSQIEEFRASGCTFHGRSELLLPLSMLQSRLMIESIGKKFGKSLRRLEFCQFTTLHLNCGYKDAVYGLPKLSNLIELQLTDNQLIEDDIFIQICVNCTNLRELSVAGCPITEIGLNAMLNLNRLAIVDVSRLDCLTDTFLIELSTKGLLETIQMCQSGTNVTKESLDRLILNCPKLATVNIRGCQFVTPEIKSELRELQDIKIVL